jgi:hypothetical protein
MTISYAEIEQAKKTHDEAELVRVHEMENEQRRAESKAHIQSQMPNSAECRAGLVAASEAAAELTRILRQWEDTERVLRARSAEAIAKVGEASMNRTICIDRLKEAEKHVSDWSARLSFASARESGKTAAEFAAMERDIAMTPIAHQPNGALAQAMEQSRVPSTGSEGIPEAIRAEAAVTKAAYDETFNQMRPAAALTPDVEALVALTKQQIEAHAAKQAEAVKVEEPASLSAKKEKASKS